ncbi:patatin-like protein [Qipengyuania sp. DGS5-3]|uniref:patatin-like protein n=1 Tax=Qipengyuania sp. DGS5-3 TaxID=3349632 RepID=UPI0036D329E6
MRQKELRIALVCYGGVSLAVYMHGVTKELWHLSRASRDFHAGIGDLPPSVVDDPDACVSYVYRRLMEEIEQQRGLRLRVLPDILTGASAGGINAVFLAQAVHSGQSLDPLTNLWLDVADVDELTDPDARPIWKFAKFWAQPIANWILKRPGNAVTESVAPETQKEVRRKVSHLVRGRWFQPPFSGLGFSSLLERAFSAMEQTPSGNPLLPQGHPLDLFVTATDFRGSLSHLNLNSPPVVEESEHRLPIAFRAFAPSMPGAGLANTLELVLAARATASFPGAFPPLQLSEIDKLAEKTERTWPEREAFLRRVMPAQHRQGMIEGLSLIDGSVLVNKPFEGAIDALQGRPAQREIDRRFVYVDPRPDRFGELKEKNTQPVGFFAAIFGSLSTLPREQPIRDNLETLEEQSAAAIRLRRILLRLRPEIEAAVEKLFGRTLFLDRPTPKRLNNWRQKAQQAAAERSGYAFQAYAQAKLAGILSRLATITHKAAPELSSPGLEVIENALRGELSRRGLDGLSANGVGAHEQAIHFFRTHDVGFRIRRLRLIARRISRDWEADPSIPDEALDQAREEIYACLSLYLEANESAQADEAFAKAAQNVLSDPAQVLDMLERKRLLPEIDTLVEEKLAAALHAMPKDLKRKILLTYLGFPFFDVATLTLLPDEGRTEFDPIKVDRISPEDARSIRDGGTKATLRGTEFYNFGAFFSRAYRENDYLWGRLHGAERMIDLLCSTLDTPLEDDVCNTHKRDAFLAILAEEDKAERCSPKLIERLRQEVLERLSSES